MILTNLLNVFSIVSFDIRKKRIIKSKTPVTLNHTIICQRQHVVVIYCVRRARHGYTFRCYFPKHRSPNVRRESRVVLVCTILYIIIFTRVVHPYTLLVECGIDEEVKIDRGRKRRARPCRLSTSRHLFTGEVFVYGSNFVPPRSNDFTRKRGPAAKSPGTTKL